MFTKTFILRRLLGSSTVLAFLVCLFAPSSARFALGQGTPLASGSDATALIGTWRYLRGSYGGQAYDVHGDVIIKLVTDGHFALLRYKGDTKEVIEAHGGTWTFSNGEYTELTTYGFGPIFKGVKGKPYQFESKVSGDEWRIQVDGGKHMEEVWKRDRD